MAVRKTPSAGPKFDKLWRDALMLCAKEKIDGKPRLRNVADKCFAAAEDGDVSAMKEIGDRLDGKAVQPVAGVENGPPISIIERVIVEATDKDG